VIAQREAGIGSQTLIATSFEYRPVVDVVKSRGAGKTFHFGECFTDGLCCIDIGKTRRHSCHKRDFLNTCDTIDMQMQSNGV
jgi:hypothetical protein